MIVGIDPGLTGGIALVSGNTVLDAAPTPTFEIGSKRDLDEHGLDRFIKQIKADHPDVTALVELVGPMPKQGVVSMFNFGGVYRATRQALASAGIPYQLVTPQKWKRALGLSADKDEALRLASRLLPASVKFWTPQRGIISKDQCKGVAEAALIALYGAKKFLP
jgi:crossover junction endodeoxyribonuclease RuvC